MLYAVTIEPLNATFFVSDKPDADDWHVDVGVELEMNPLYGTWTPDRPPIQQILCVSTVDPKLFKVFRNPEDIDSSEFHPTGRHFGGLYSRSSWERFARHVPPALATLEVSHDEPPGATEEAISALKRND
jgi:hypothetical protein